MDIRVGERRAGRTIERRIVRWYCVEKRPGFDRVASYSCGDGRAGPDAAGAIGHSAADGLERLEAKMLRRKAKRIGKKPFKFRFVTTVLSADFEQGPEWYGYQRRRRRRGLAMRAI